MKEYTKPIIIDENIELEDVIAKSGDPVETKAFGTPEPGDKIIPDFW